MLLGHTINATVPETRDHDTHQQNMSHELNPSETNHGNDVYGVQDQPDRRIWIVIAAGVIITLMCVWRAVTPRMQNQIDGLPLLKRPAPPFQLYDQASTLVNLDAYLHRHKIVIVFFDGQLGPEKNETLVELRRFYPALKKEGIAVFGVSTALPQENRRNSDQPFPFPLLSDADAVSPRSVHRVWGRFIEPPSLDKPPGTKPGVFRIDRAGLVRWDVDANLPIPEANPVGIVAQLLNDI